MKKTLIALCAVLFFLLVSAQRSQGQRFTENYRYRTFDNKPPYALQKITRLINKSVKGDSHFSFMPEVVLTARVYNSLSLREKFTYNILNREQYAQICSVMPVIKDDTDRIFAWLPNPHGEFVWSERQEKFFLSNRDSVMFFIRKSSVLSHRVGISYKQVLVDINAVEMIPFLIQQYKKGRRDHDILTVLLLLLMRNKFPPFIHSPEYTILYGPESSRKSFIDFNAYNEQRILLAAKAFYNGSN